MEEYLINELRKQDALLQNLSISDTVTFDNFNVKSKSIVFKGVGFSSTILFENLNLETIVFQNCVFSTLILKNVKLKGKLISKDSISECLLIDDCRSRGAKSFIDISIKDCFFEGLCYLSRTKGLQIQITTGSLKSLRIDDSNFEGVLGISNNVLVENILLNSVSFNKEFSIAQTSCDLVRIENCTFQSKCFITNSKLKKILRFEKCVHNADIKIENITALSNSLKLQIENGNYTGNFDVYYWDLEGNNKQQTCFKNILIKESTFFGNLNIIKKQNYSDDLLYSSDLHVLNLSNNNFNGILQVEGFRSINIRVEGENLKGNLFFKNLQLHSIHIDKLNNYGNLQFIHCESDYIYQYTSLSICNSYFERTNFTNCDLSSFMSYEIKNSNFSNIKSTNTKWFHYKSLKHNKISHKELTEGGFDVHESPEQFARSENRIENRTFQEMRETFRQLKYAMESQGDRITALRFKRDEMKAYYSYIKEEKDIPFGDKFILKVGWTNDHGQNWLRPLGLLILSSFVFYCSMLLIFCSCLGIISNLDIYFQLLNPTHSFDKIFNWTLSPAKTILLNFLDLFHKIILSFLIFQTISAFRKFIK